MKTRINSKLICVMVAAVFAAVLSIALAGCAPAGYTPSQKEAQLHKPDILEEGKLKVGVDFGNPPMAGEASRPSGIDVDVASAIADDLGLEVEFVDVGTSPDLALSNKKVDIAVGISSSAKFSDVWMSEAYIKTAPAIFAKDDSLPIPQKGGSDKFATEMGSVSAIAAQEQFDAANIKLDSTLSASFEALNNGEVKYVAADAIIGTYGSLQADMETNIVALLTQPGGYCVGALSANSKLTDKVKGSLETLAKGGILSVIERSWLGKNLDLANEKYTAEGASKSPVNEADGVYGTSSND